MAHERAQPVQTAAAPAPTPSAPAPQGGRTGLVKTLRGLDYEGGRAAVSPPGDPRTSASRAAMTSPGDATERDADRRAARTGPLSPGNLGNARLHAGGEADPEMHRMGAKALTRGQDIYLRGDVAPDSPEGGGILAHEAGHAAQPEAEDRMAAWWDDGHQAITRNVGLKMQDKIDPEASDFVARKAGALDRTYQSMKQNFMQYLGVAGEMKEQFLGDMAEGQENDLVKEREAHGIHTPPKPEKPVESGTKKKKSKWTNKDKVKTKESSVEESQKRWDRLEFHVRLPNEMPLHGEAGGYVSDGGVGRNRQAVEDLVQKAADSYNRASGRGVGNYREGLNRLADAAHANEDRGSHGEGMPFTGHDPRLQFPTQPNGQPNPNYRPGWDCDDVSKNTGGRALAEDYAREVFDSFIGKLNPDKAANLKEGKGGGKSRGIGLRNTIKHVGEKSGKRGLEDPQSLVRDNDAYEKIKLQAPSPTSDPNSNALENMDRFIAGGGLVRDLESRLGVLRGEVSPKNVVELEKVYKKFSRLADAADAVKHYARTLMTDAWGMVDEKTHPNESKVVKEAGMAAQRFRTLASQTEGKLKKDEIRRLSMAVGVACRDHQKPLVDAARVLWPGVVQGSGGEQVQPEQEAPTTEQKGNDVLPQTGKQPQQTISKTSRTPSDPLSEAREQARLDSILVLRELKAGVHTPVEMEKGKDKYQYFSKLLGRVAKYRDACPQGSDERIRAGGMCTKIEGWIQTIHGPKKGHATLLGDTLQGVSTFLDAVENR